MIRKPIKILRYGIKHIGATIMLIEEREKEKKEVLFEKYVS